LARPARSRRLSRSRVRPAPGQHVDNTPCPPPSAHVRLHQRGVGCRTETVPTLSTAGATRLRGSPSTRMMQSLGGGVRHQAAGYWNVRLHDGRIGWRQAGQVSLSGCSLKRCLLDSAAAASHATLPLLPTPAAGRASHQRILRLQQVFSGAWTCPGSLPARRAFRLTHTYSNVACGESRALC
jgi:hypothetical protein